MIAAFPNQNFSPPSELGRNVPKRSYPSFYLHVMPSCRITRAHDRDLVPRIAARGVLMPRPVNASAISR
jgi:hypothetical protein